jgi:hypothetical protein
MSEFQAGDDLIFQLESGFGLLLVLAVEGEGAGTVWHLLAYEDFYPSVEAAESALAAAASALDGTQTLSVRKAHMALTNRAFERPPAARLGNRPVREEELVEYHKWLEGDRAVSDRSALLMLGIR